MNNTKSRRSFIASSLAAGAALFAAPALLSGRNRAGLNTDAAQPFRMGYAPTLGMFRDLCGSDDPVDNIKFCYDTGFRAVFDNSFPGRPVAEQERIAAEVKRLGMMMGPWVLYADFSKTSFVLDHDEVHDFLKAKMEEGIEVARRSGFKMMLMVPGRYDERLHPDYQRANVIDNFKYCAELAEPEGITIVMEPLNTLHDHPGMYLTSMPQAFQICEAVGSPSVRIVDDLYHQQITEGNLIPNIDTCWSQIAAFHVGDNPGRNEPTSGEINYRNVFRYLYDKEYKGVICMEHGRSISGPEGARRIIDAYRECDSF